MYMGGLQTRTILTNIMPHMDPARKPPASPAGEPDSPAPGAGPVLDSRELLLGRAEVLIRHEGRLYRLRRTRLGKLILTA
jgi:hemin uptake protein HemP